MMGPRARVEGLEGRGTPFLRPCSERRCGDGRKVESRGRPLIESFGGARDDSERSTNLFRCHAYPDSDLCGWQPETFQRPMIEDPVGVGEHVTRLEDPLNLDDVRFVGEDENPVTLPNFRRDFSDAAAKGSDLALDPMRDRQAFARWWTTSDCGMKCQYFLEQRIAIPLEGISDSAVSELESQLRIVGETDLLVLVLVEFFLAGKGSLQLRWCVPGYLREIVLYVRNDFREEERVEAEESVPLLGEESKGRGPSGPHLET